ncbi:hypothetical protein LTR53_001119 [Teratosphaeriaceae sp. CCFEE 6253]|nr:hypothetical protein LTR53_001119 [Teratosphaeriaceae sp. CCFEE 6253]
MSSDTRLFSKSEKRYYVWSRRNDAYVWEDDGTLVSQRAPVPQRAPVQGRAPTASHIDSGSSSRDDSRTTQPRDAGSSPRAAPRTLQPADLPAALDRLNIGPTPGPPAGGQGSSAPEPKVSDVRTYADGAKEFTATDRRAGVQTTWRIGPSQKIGDRRYNEKAIRGGNGSDEADYDGRGSGGGGGSGGRGGSGDTGGSGGGRGGGGGSGGSGGRGGSGDTGGSGGRGKEKAGGGAKQGKRTRRNYLPGQVIEMDVVPPPSSRFSEVSTSTLRPGAPQLMTGGTRAAVRRFVVMQPATESNPNIEAITYDQQGVAGVDEFGQEVVKAHHAVIYTGNPTRWPAPFPTVAEQPRIVRGVREPAMLTVPILVALVDRARPLDPMSRINFFDVYDIDTSHPDIRIYGTVHRDSLEPLRAQYRAVQASAHANAPAARAAAPPPNPLAVQPAPVQDVQAMAAAVSANAAISVGVLADYLDYLRRYAQENRFTAPPALNAEQLQYLAATPSERSVMLARLWANWREQAQAQAQSAARRGQ